MAFNRKQAISSLRLRRISLGLKLLHCEPTADS
jgi:hypothetical protein